MARRREKGPAIAPGQVEGGSERSEIFRKRRMRNSIAETQRTTSSSNTIVHIGPHFVLKSAPLRAISGIWRVVQFRKHDKERARDSEHPDHQAPHV